MKKLKNFIRNKKTQISQKKKSIKRLEKAVVKNDPWTLKGISERVFSFLFKGLTYNQIWEDPRVDMEALKIKKDSRMLVIASAGCNILNYLTASPKSIDAVDLNSSHIYFTNLKIAALKYLPSYRDFFYFFGLGKTYKNIKNYRKYISRNIDYATRQYWEGGIFRRLAKRQRIRYFRKNIYNYGLLGRLLCFTHSVSRMMKRDISSVLWAKNIKEQKKLYRKNIEPVFNDKKFKLLVNAITPLVSSGLGIPPAQWKLLKTECGGDIVLNFKKKIENMICSYPISENYFAWQSLSRKYDIVQKKAIPDYLKKKNYDTIKKNAKKVHTHITSLQLFMKQQNDCTFDRFVFLDSQDWMSPAEIRELWEEVARVGKPGARIIFRTALKDSPVESALPKSLKKDFESRSEESKKLLKKDRTGIYGGFHLYVYKGGKDEHSCEPYGQHLQVPKAHI